MKLNKRDIKLIEIHYPYGEKHMTVGELARLIGCSETAINYNARKLGLKNLKFRCELTDDDLQEIRLHYPPGPDHWSVKKLAEWIGCHPDSIRYNANKMGFRSRMNWTEEERRAQRRIIRHESYLKLKSNPEAYQKKIDKERERRKRWK